MYNINISEEVSLEKSEELNKLYTLDDYSLTYKVYFKYKSHGEFFYSLNIPALTEILDEVPAWRGIDLLKLMTPINIDNSKATFEMFFGVNDIYISYKDLYNSKYSHFASKENNLTDLLAELAIKIAPYKNDTRRIS